MPVIPKTEVSLIKTNENENFVMQNDIENNIVMFCCRSNIDFLTTLEMFI